MSPWIWFVIALCVVSIVLWVAIVLVVLKLEARIKKEKEEFLLHLLQVQDSFRVKK